MYKIGLTMTRFTKCESKTLNKVKIIWHLCMTGWYVGLRCYLHYLLLFVYSGVEHILCCVFVLFFFVLCTLCCQFLWIVFVLFFFILCTLCCQFLWIVFVLFFFVLCTLDVASFSGLSFFDLYSLTNMHA